MILRHLFIIMLTSIGMLSCSETPSAISQWHERITLKTNSDPDLFETIVGSRCFLYRLKELEPATKLKSTSGKSHLIAPLQEHFRYDQYAFLLLAFYTLTGEFDLVVPSQWWPSQVEKTNTNHPLNVLKKLALIKMPEACFFLKILYAELSETQVDEWYKENTELILATLQECEELIDRNPKLASAWDEEKKWISKRLKKFLALGATFDDIVATYVA